MFKKYKGLIEETMRSGNVRLRVRVRGNPNKKITIHLPFDHPKFNEHYELARLGIEPPKPEQNADADTIHGSIGWLCDQYKIFIEKKVTSGLLSPKTLKKRIGQFKYLKERYADFDLAMPRSMAIEIHENRADKPSSADDLLEMMSSMYDWAIKKDYCKENPAKGIERYNVNNGGTVSWSLDDVQQYKNFYPIGTTEYAALALILFTACRIGDPCFLGRKHEIQREDGIWLAWQPGKKGSLPMDIPMADQLYQAVRALKVQGPTYLMTAYGKPFASEDAMSTWFITRCKRAGLKKRSAHGLRKAAGAILAEMGCSTYEIKALHGHSNSTTSEIYTRGANRAKLAKQAVTKLSSIKW